MVEAAEQNGSANAEEVRERRIYIIVCVGVGEIKSERENREKERSFFTSKLSSSAATLFRLSSAYLIYNIECVCVCVWVRDKE